MLAAQFKQNERIQPDFLSKKTAAQSLAKTANHGRCGQDPEGQAKNREAGSPGLKFYFLSVFLCVYPCFSVLVRFAPANSREQGAQSTEHGEPVKWRTSCAIINKKF
jgi:hypothetical protein